MKIMGLSEGDCETISAVFARFPNLKNVTLFGSRALGHYRIGSDVDLAIRCENKESTPVTANQLSANLNQETPLPYQFDVLDLDHTTHIDLLEHIETHGQLIWRSNKNE